MVVLGIGINRPSIIPPKIIIMMLLMMIKVLECLREVKDVGI